VDLATKKAKPADNSRRIAGGKFMENAEVCHGQMPDRATDPLLGGVFLGAASINPT
jgi:hypothetical protein